MLDLATNPFFLDESQQKWVKETLSAMSVEEKIGQLFCEISYCRPEEFREYFSEIQPGGIMFRPNRPEVIQDYIDRYQAKSKLPLLFAANLERGANGIYDNGTYYGSEMQVAATNDDECGRQLGAVCGRESAAVGLNWSFAPVVDLDYNFLSPITNMRTFGTDPEKVIRMAKGYMKGIRPYHVASTLKHFPGDGMDFRDQHKVASVNTKSMEDWDATYGKVYRALIDEGAECVMSAHIKLPAYSKHFSPDVADRDVLPASLSYELNVKLLREKLGFNGLIVSDDTHMAGFMACMEREKAVPMCIASGVDMFLFTVDHKEDVAWMKKGYEDGVITPERLEEAVARILALKAKLHLHEKDRGRIPGIDSSAVACREHADLAYECADKAVTLVKDRDGILPLSPKKYKRILLRSIDYYATGRCDNCPQYEKFKQSLLDEGFEVDELNLDNMPAIDVLGVSIQKLKERYDLMIYFAGARAGFRIQWKADVCGDIPNYVKEIPTLAVSFGSPYLLMDMPMVGTYINAYSESDFTRKAVVEKLMGRSEFKGVSPVDPFCGMWDLPL